MSTTFRLETALSVEDNQRLFGWGENIFGSSPGPVASSPGPVTAAPSPLVWRTADVHLLLCENNTAVSHASLFRHTLTRGNGREVIGGVGAVVTNREYQRRGYAHRLMEYAAVFFKKEWQADFGLLFCRDELIGFYEKLGWRTVPRSIVVDQPSGKTIIPAKPMVLPLAQSAWPEQEIDLQSLPW